MKLQAMLAFARGKAVMPLALGSAAWLFWQWLQEPPKNPAIAFEIWHTETVETCRKCHDGNILMFGDMPRPALKDPAKSVE